MSGSPHTTAHHDDDFTLDPDLFESDATLGRSSVYQEEAGKQSGRSSSETLHPCPTCGIRVIAGLLDNGTLVHVEPDVPMYTMLWRNKEPLPRLTLGRGYPGHRCGTALTHEV